MLLTKLSLQICLIFTVLVTNSSQDLQKDISLQTEKQNGTYLSRKRRYLMFPSGSSFQLVFCLTYPSVAVGSYFVFGHTAALAWELPSMPLFFDQRDFEKKDEAEEDAETTTTEMPPAINFSELDHNAHDRVGGDIPFWTNEKVDENPQFPNPSFNRKHTIHENPFLGFVKKPGYGATKPNHIFTDDTNMMGNNIEGSSYLDYSRIHDDPSYFSRYNDQKSHMMFNMHPKYYQAHRRTRRDLYRKIENFLNTINLDGKSCLLKAICELSTYPHEKGTFVEEVFKAIFRVKPHNQYQDEDDYDAAANPDHNCTEMYSTCRGSIRNVRLLTRK